jgi:hypothetical protein
LATRAEGYSRNAKRDSDLGKEDSRNRSEFANGKLGDRLPMWRYALYIIFGFQVSMNKRMKARKPRPIRTWRKAKIEMSR